MAKQKQIMKAQPEKKSRLQRASSFVAELDHEPPSSSGLPAGATGLGGNSSYQAQAARLSDHHLQSAQRQTIAAQIGCLQGNQHLQRVIVSQDGDANLVQTELTADTSVAPAQRVVGNTIQRSFWDRVWGAMRSAGRAIASGVRAVGRAIARGVRRLGGHLRDAGLWLVNLIRDLPARLRRLAITLCEGLAGVARFIPDAIRALASGGLRGLAEWLWQRAVSGGAWVLSLLARVFDVPGGPEIVEFIVHLVTRATRLTEAEIAAASSVLGPSAIRYRDVRVAEGGILNLIFWLNDRRAFALWHTINMPSGSGGRSNLDIIVHELVHAYQNEKVGTVYMGQAIYGQATIGYGYGEAEGLTADRTAGKHYRDYNREQQAQIAQDYYNLRQSGMDITAYQPFIAELQAGDL